MRFCNKIYHQLSCEIGVGKGQKKCGRLECVLLFFLKVKRENYADILGDNSWDNLFFILECEAFKDNTENYGDIMGDSSCDNLFSFIGKE